MRITRVAMLVIAAAVVTWLAVSFSNSRLLAHGGRVLATQHPSQARVTSALSDVRAAHTWTDPTEALSFEAALDILAGRLDAARRIYEQIVRREPEGVEAWVVLSELSAKSDPARAAYARAQAARLDPLAATRR